MPYKDNPVMSPLCQNIESEGYTLRVEIYGCSESGWVLEVVDQFNNSTVWDQTFQTEQQALNEATKTIELEGIKSLIGSPTSRQSFTR